MDIKLHFNATTTPKIRAYIQQSEKSDIVLAKELGISLQTVKKWRNRKDVLDRSHTPNKIKRTLSFEQEILIAYLRLRLALTLDELVEVTQLLINKNASRAGVSRCLQKQKISRLSKKNLSNIVGQVWLDIIKLPEQLEKNKPYLLILIEKVTGYISFACLDESVSREKNIVQFFSTALPYKINSVEIDNSPLAQKIASQLSSKILIQNTLPIIQTNPIDFAKDFTQLIYGKYTDSRLGIDALLLMYEEYLNTKLCRSRLNKMTPLQYLTL